jgi:hypothetical protein
MVAKAGDLDLARTIWGLRVCDWKTDEGCSLRDELTAESASPAGSEPWRSSNVAVIRWPRGNLRIAASFAWRDSIAGTSLDVGGNGAQGFC